MTRNQIIDLVLIFYDVLVTRPLYNLYAHAFELPGHTSSAEKKIMAPNWERYDRGSYAT